MQKKDYMVRQLEEFGKVMATILRFKKENDWEKFDQEVTEAAHKFTQLKMDHVEGLDEAGFDQEILKGSGLNLDQKKILADLLFEKLKFYLERDDRGRYLKLKSLCLALYTHIRENLTENEFDLNVYYKLEYLQKSTD